MRVSKTYVEGETTDTARACDMKARKAFRIAASLRTFSASMAWILGLITVAHDRQRKSQTSRSGK